MKIIIDNRSGRPIYDQIYAQIKAQILCGDIAPEEMLPSIRSLAKDLRISVITTKRAYEELEREGFLYTVAGKGCFAAPKNLALLREEMLRQIEAHMQEISALAHSCGLKREDLIEMLDTIVETEAETA
ncbi:MAG: GntR family transcriptional regulator [Clostridia bacterium]|nr:GntR family transcriptional regulator [Clostridia bacterium]